MGPGRSSSLRIRGDSSAAAGSGRTGGASDRLTGVDLQDALWVPPFPLDKGKGRVDQIKYLGGQNIFKDIIYNKHANHHNNKFS